MTMLLTPAEIKPNSFEMRRNSFLLLLFFFSGCASYLRACLGARLLPHPNFSEGADRVGGQLHGDKERPFIGVTKSGRVWRKVPESDVRSVGPLLCQLSPGGDAVVQSIIGVGQSHDGGSRLSE